MRFFTGWLGFLLVGWLVCRGVLDGGFIVVHGSGGDWWRSSWFLVDHVRVVLVLVGGLEAGDFVF